MHTHVRKISLMRNTNKYLMPKKKAHIVFKVSYWTSTFITVADTDCNTDYHVDYLYIHKHRDDILS